MIDFDHSAFMDFQQSWTRVFHRCHGTPQDVCG